MSMRCEFWVAQLRGYLPPAALPEELTGNIDTWYLWVAGELVAAK